LTSHSGTYQMLTNHDVSAVVAILAATADITLVLTPDGVICDRVMASPDIPEKAFMGWPGKSWNETVTIESRIKIEQLLHEASMGQPARARQVNHPISGSQDLPIKYTAVRVGREGHIVAAGRDLTSVAALQQRLLAAEQEIEQEYLRLRHSETRFRVLLQSASDAILIVDAKTGRVVETNPAAASLLNRPSKRILGSAIEDVFSEAEASGVKRLLATMRSTGKADDLALRLDDENRQAILSVTMFRQDTATYYLLRMVPHAVGTSAIVMPRSQSKVVKIISEMPDGFVVTDLDRRILTANAAFLELAQLGSEEQARGNTIDQWIGRPGIDTTMLTTQLMEKGAIRNFRSIARGQFGAVEDVEISGVSVQDGDMPCLGFTIHRISRQSAAAQSKPESSLLRSGDDFTRLVGKVPLKELIRESTDIIERLCIESALQLNSDNRAGAAEMLGISRQSLYVKLHRYGIDGPDADVNN
jgi:transcriptional regulator PpsR